MFNKKLLGLAISATLLTIAQNSLAGTSSATANYEITLGSACSVTATGQIFPSQLVGATADLWGTSAGSVTVVCNPGVQYDWGINGGSHANSYWWSTRHMNSLATGQNVPYNLRYNGSTIGDDGLQLRDASYAVTTNGWGQSAAMIAGVMTGTGAAQSYNLTSDIYLSAMPGGYMAGTYADTVTVTVAF